MLRWSALAFALFTASGFAAAADPPPASSQKIGCFNMAKVLRDFDKAKTRVAGLNEQRTRLLANIEGLNAMLADLPESAKKVPDAAQQPMPVFRVMKEADGTTATIEIHSGDDVPLRELRDAQLLIRLIKLREKEARQILEDRANEVRSGLYDDIYVAAAATAKAHGLCALLAYPDAITDEDKQSAAVKELKLKPPAASPFFLGASADYTDELLSRLNGKPTPEAPAPRTKPADAAQKIGFFNMAQVMRDYELAKYQVAMLNKQRTDLSRDLIAWRSEYIKLQEDFEKEKNGDAKEKLAKRMIQLARKIEDKDREVDKIQNDAATKIICDLYDDIHAVVTEVAREKGLSAVLAYPDAVTEEEKNRPEIKELKLKPPAASPFYLDPSADYTGEIIKRLNKKKPAPPLPKFTIEIPPVPSDQPGKK